MAAGEHIVDARGERCPLPVLRMEKALEPLVTGERLVVLASDPMAKVDIPLYCRQHAHACEVTQENGVLRFAIVKAANPQASA